MLKKRFLSAVVSTLFLFIALTPAALAARAISQMRHAAPSEGRKFHDAIYRIDTLHAEE